MERLTSCFSPPLSLLPLLMQRAALTTISGERAHRGPSLSDTSGLPRHSGAGERKAGGREGGRECVITKEIPLYFLPLAQITTDFHHNTAL